MSWPPHIYRTSGENREVPPQIIEAALDDAFLVQREHRLPPILTLKHLSIIADCSYRSLRSIVERTHQHPYRLFQIKKRSSGSRLICVPCGPLLQVQRWLNRFVLQVVPSHPCSMAFARGQSIFDCALKHCGCQWLIKLDVRRFFESISERQVYRVFARLGYRPLVSFELCRLLTRVPHKRPHPDRRHRWSNGAGVLKRQSLSEYHSIEIGHLPQGAPTSPLLSNLCVRQLDDKLNLLAHQMQLVYTRYADDIVFSTRAPFSRESAMDVVATVKQELSALGLSANSTKTSIVPPGARKVVLGLLVDRDRPRLQQSFKKQMELHVYFLRKLGPLAHATKRNFDSVFALKVFLDGKVSFMNSVEPDFANAIQEQLAAIEWPFTS